MYPAKNILRIRQNAKIKELETSSVSNTIICSVCAGKPSLEVSYPVADNRTGKIAIKSENYCYECIKLVYER